MAKKIQPVSVPEELYDEFIEHRDSLMKITGLNFSEICRKIIMQGDVLHKDELSEFYSRESKKTTDHTYLVITI
jgi:hypothetical protein